MRKKLKILLTTISFTNLSVINLNSNASTHETQINSKATNIITTTPEEKLTISEKFQASTSEQEKTAVISNLQKENQELLAKLAAMEKTNNEIIANNKKLEQEKSEQNNKINQLEKDAGEITTKNKQLAAKNLALIKKNERLNWKIYKDINLIDRIDSPISIEPVNPKVIKLSDIRVATKAAIVKALQTFIDPSLTKDDYEIACSDYYNWNQPQHIDLATAKKIVIIIQGRNKTTGSKQFEIILPALRS